MSHDDRPAAIAFLGLLVAMAGPTTQALAAASFGLVHFDPVSAAPEYQSHCGTIAAALSFTMDDTIAGLDQTGVASSARLWQSLHNDGQNVGLHLLAKTNSAPPWPLAEHGGAYANGDLMFFDSFQVVGGRNAYALGESVVDFSNTGFMQLTALGGLGIGSVSGLTYAAPPAAAVPEPPTAIMLVVASGTVGMGRLFRRKRGVASPGRAAAVRPSQRTVRRRTDIGMAHHPNG